jgi:hypothetical protein
MGSFAAIMAILPEAKLVKGTLSPDTPWDLAHCDLKNLGFLDRNQRLEVLSFVRANLLGWTANWPEERSNAGMRLPAPRQGPRELVRAWFTPSPPRYPLLLPHHKSRKPSAIPG